MSKTLFLESRKAKNTRIWSRKLKYNKTWSRKLKHKNIYAGSKKIMKKNWSKTSRKSRNTKVWTRKLKQQNLCGVKKTRVNNLVDIVEKIEEVKVWSTKSKTIWTGSSKVKHIFSCAEKVKKYKHLVETTETLIFDTETPTGPFFGVRFLIITFFSGRFNYLSSLIIYLKILPKIMVLWEFS